MFHTIKTVLTNPPPASIFPRSLLSSNLGRETSTIRFCTKPDHSENSANPKMENKAQKPKEETTHHGDVMSHSFGEGYSTRSDEEGFGGTYGGNQSFQKDRTTVHENHPDYDKTQGSEVKEKEKSRHQTYGNA